MSEGHCHLLSCLAPLGLSLWMGSPVWLYLVIEGDLGLTKNYGVGALLLCLFLLPISLSPAVHACTPRARTKADIYRITFRQGSKDDLKVYLVAQT